MSFDRLGGIIDMAFYLEGTVGLELLLLLVVDEGTVLYGA